MLQVQSEPSRTPVEHSFIQQVLTPYAGRDCVYLKSASTATVYPGPSIHATFAIPVSCYIDSTGHFNAVEFNICYNQMTYVLLADCVRRGAIPQLSDWSIQQFFERQLPDVLITRYQCRFRRAIDSASFWAEVHFQRITHERGKPIYLQTVATFFDGKHGLAEAEVELAIVDRSQRSS
jgi:hypothetical protein